MHGIGRAIDRLRPEHPEEVVLVAPVAAEIQFGLERLPAGSRRRRLLEAEYWKLRRVLRWEDWTEQAANAFGRQKARLMKGGEVIDDFDIAIASAALALGARLATLNVEHLGRIRGLTVEDWS